jgi:hypothetical protein
MVNPPQRDSIPQRLRHMLLTDDFVEGLGPIF